MSEFAWCKSAWFVVVVIVTVWGWPVIVSDIILGVIVIFTVDVTIATVSNWGGTTITIAVIWEVTTTIASIWIYKGSTTFNIS